MGAPWRTPLLVLAGLSAAASARSPPALPPRRRLPAETESNAPHVEDALTQSPRRRGIELAVEDVGRELESSANDGGAESRLAAGTHLRSHAANTTIDATAAARPAVAPSAPAPPPSSQGTADASSLAQAVGTAPLGNGSSKVDGQLVLAARGRALSSVTVTDFPELETEVAGSATEIRLTAGTYDVMSTLTISRDVTITVDVEGAAVVLDGQGSTRVLHISSGATVQLVGLDITNGNAGYVRLLAS